jgi:hypothetical protein
MVHWFHPCFILHFPMYIILVWSWIFLYGIYYILLFRFCSDVCEYLLVSWCRTICEPWLYWFHRTLQFFIIPVFCHIFSWCYFRVLLAFCYFPYCTWLLNSSYKISVFMNAVLLECSTVDNLFMHKAYYCNTIIITSYMTLIPIYQFSLFLHWNLTEFVCGA